MRAERARVSQHAAALTLFAALALGWTWPLAARIGAAIPGEPGDNYSFVWNFWWMRRALAIPGVEFFRTTHLFYPFGTTLVDHPHTALPALIAATILSPLSIVTTLNLLLMAFVFANMACMYALAWDATRHARAAVLAALIFGLSPYLAGHLLGHFDLVAAWVLPLFALFLRRALRGRSNIAAACAGIVAAIAAYTTYYYVVYLMFFAGACLLAWMRPLSIRWRDRSHPAPRWIVALLVGGVGLLAAVAVSIAATGGTTFHLGSLVVSMRTPQNTLSAMWTVSLILAAVWWRPSVAGRGTCPGARWRGRRALVVAGITGGIFLVCASPLLWRAAQLVERGEYVTQRYVWRNVPLGVDLATPFIGHPRHPLTGSWSRRVYASLGLDDIEAVGWLGIAPVLILAVTRTDRPGRPDARIWRTSAVVFGVLALGPLLTAGGFDTGLRLPAILLRYVPFVENARMPGRAMAGVFLALAMILAWRIRSARGIPGSPAGQWFAIALVAFEYWDAPIPLTVLDRPQVYQALAAEPDGAVCEVPFGIGDGLSTGVGSQDRRALYDATLHEHPLVGGYVGRMPGDAARRYEKTPVAGDLLRLSSGRQAAGPAVVDAAESPCRYFVVHRTASEELRGYVEKLPVEMIAEDAEARLYRLNLR
jgi:hypothetical protein